MNRAASLLGVVVGVVMVPAAGFSADCNRNGVDDLADLVPARLGFPTPTRLDLDPLVWGFQLADLDGDGTMEVLLLAARQYDTVCSCFTGSTVDVLRRSEDGSLVLDGEYPVPPIPLDAAVADLDADGDLDIATVSQDLFLSGLTRVSVLLNRGEGSFAEAVNLAGGPGASGIVAADLDGDGDTDLATADTGGASFSIHSNLGDAAFGEAAPIPAGEMPMDLAAGDIDGDGDADIVVASTDSSFFEGDIAVRKGRGDGSFEEPLLLDGGVLVRAVELFDVDSDGDLDLVSAASGNCCPYREGDVRVFLNDGSGVFGSPNILDEGPGGALAVVAADVNADGRLDLAAASNVLGVVVFRALGGGAFGEPVRFAVGRESQDLQAGDLDGDGDPDLATVDYTGLVILANRGEGAFGGGLNLPTGPEEENAEAVAAADLDGDGDMDLVVASGGSSSLVAMLNDGRAGFAAGARRVVGKRPIHMASGDLDGDGWMDFVTADYGEYEDGRGSISIVRGLGGGELAPADVILETGRTSSVALADFDGDGRLDIANPLNENLAREANDQVSIRFNLGDARFSEAADVAAGRAPTGIAAGDIDGDRRPDVATANFLDGTVSILLNEGKGSFRREGDVPLGHRAYSVALVDLNGDSVLDLAVGNSIEASIWTAPGVGGGRFAPARVVPTGMSPFRLSSGDFDRDGRLDLITANWNTSDVSLLLGDGAGGFAAERRYAAGSYCRGITAADLDGDGDLDAVTANSAPQGSVTVLLNETVPAVSLDADRNSVPDECQEGRFHRGDANSSGVIDISDAIAIFNFLFLGGAAPGCLDAADADDSGQLNLTDGIFALSYLFRGERPPPHPGPPGNPCGVDPGPEGAAGRLGCDRYTPCEGA